MPQDQDMALLTEEPLVRRRRLTVAEYYRMAELGILAHCERVELIEGSIVMMAAIASPHAGAVNALTRLLMYGAAGRAVVSVQNPVRLDDHSEPQADVILLKPRADDYRRATPTAEDVLLLVEVADSSARYDRQVKLPLYARHGIPELWIVDVSVGEVVVCRGPESAGYNSVVVAGRDAVLEPVNVAGATVPGAALMD